MAFDTELLNDLLVCPKSRARLVQHHDALVSTDPVTRLRYEIRDGIPNMLIDEARTVPLDEWSRIMQEHGRDGTTGQPPNTNGPAGNPS